MNSSYLNIGRNKKYWSGVVYSVGGFVLEMETVFHGSVMSVHVWGQAQTALCSGLFKERRVFLWSRGQACFLLLMTVP